VYHVRLLFVISIDNQVVDQSLIIQGNLFKVETEQTNNVSTDNKLYIFVHYPDKYFKILHAPNSIASKYEYEFWNATLKTNEHRKSIHAFGQLESDAKL
jgi:hypothetical protein